MEDGLFRLGILYIFPIVHYFKAGPNDMQLSPFLPLPV